MWRLLKLFLFMIFNWCVMFFALLIGLSAFWPEAYAQHETDRRVSEIEQQIEGPNGIFNRLTQIEMNINYLKESSEKRDADWVPKGTVGLVALLTGERAYARMRKRVKEEEDV